MARDDDQEEKELLPVALFPRSEGGMSPQVAARDAPRPTARPP